MAHVLLGFHKYSADDVKGLGKKAARKCGPLGRNDLPLFKMWRSNGCVIEQVVRSVSETLGPAGDHLGLRDRWEAHCTKNGVKSLIGNYRDNRFNGIFQTSAEIMVHMEDMIDIASSVKQPNKKLIAVKADLKCVSIQTLLQCFGLMYLKVTGPYWNLGTSKIVPYLMLYKPILEMVDSLKKCAEEPKLLLSSDDLWENGAVCHVVNQKLNENKLFKKPPNKEILDESISVVSSAMVRCIEKQLSDFLPEGLYSVEPSSADLKQTSFAHVTNLACEHHFGDLDSSQRRRQNASMHHHSSIQLLKRNCTQMVEWISDMDNNKKSII